MSKFKNIISGFISASMILSSAAFAEETESTPLYTAHIWETFENENTGELGENQLPFENVYRNGSGGWDYVDSNYGKGVKFMKNSEKVAETVWPQLDIKLNNPLTVADAVKNSLTVEVEFDCYGAELGTDYNYIWFSSNGKNPSDSDTKIQVKLNGQTKITNYGNKEDTTIKSGNATDFVDFHTFKFVIHASDAAYSYTDTETNKTVDVAGWVLDKFYYDGVSQANKAKYDEGLYIGAGDFTDLLFQIKSWANEGGELGVDNVSVASYTTPDDGVSPVPDRKAYMDTLASYKTAVDAYNTSDITAAYNEAAELIESDYVLQSNYDDAINKLKALLPTVITNYTFDTESAVKGAIVGGLRYIFDDTKLASYFANEGALSWDFDYDNTEGQWGKSTKIALEDANGTANPVNFASMPANSYVETAFDIVYNLNDESFLRLQLNDSSNNPVTKLNMRSDKIESTFKGHVTVPSTENELHRFKLVMQVTDENGVRVNKLKGLYLDGNKYTTDNVVWENTILDSYANFEIFVNTNNSNNVLPDDTTDVSQFWIDNFSVVTYTSEDDSSMVGDKSKLLKKIEKLSELYYAQDAEDDLKASIDAVIEDIVTVYKDASANEEAVKAAEAKADTILINYATVEITDIKVVDAEGAEVALSEGTSVSAVSFTDEYVISEGACIIVAAYLKDGNDLILKNITFAEPESVTAGENETEVSLTLPSQTENRVVKAFMWSSLDNLVPLANNLEISE